MDDIVKRRPLFCSKELRGRDDVVGRRETVKKNEKQEDF